jgi:hypothetical protein
MSHPPSPTSPRHSSDCTEQVICSAGFLGVRDSNSGMGPVNLTKRCFAFPRFMQSSIEVVSYNRGLLQRHSHSPSVSYQAVHRIVKNVLTGGTDHSGRAV